MFRPLKGHHKAFYLKQVFKILCTLMGSQKCKQHFKDLFQIEGLMMTL